MLWPWLLSRHSTSTRASTMARARARRSGPTPTAAPTRRRPWGSLQAQGYSVDFWMSLTVISPRRAPRSSTTSSFSMRCFCRMALASCRVVPTGTVTRFLQVITSRTGSSQRVSNRRSRLVRMPTSLPFSTTGTPEMRYLAIIASASRMGASGWITMGSVIMPLSERLTLSTSSAWRSMGRFLWMTPRPPCWARAMASRPSVTVSMAAESRGMPSRTLRREPGAQVHFGRVHFGGPGHQQHVVEGQGLSQGQGQHGGLDVKEGSGLAEPCIPWWHGSGPQASR